MDRQQWEEIGLGVGSLAFIGVGLYVLDKQGLISLPSFGSGGPPSIAPSTLPSAVTTNRCGDVYVSFGVSTADPAKVILGKYVNKKLVAEYYQKVSVSTAMTTAGHAVGGDPCHATSRTTHHTASPTPSGSLASKHSWINLGGGCYQANGGATLWGLSVVTGVSVATLMRKNNIQNARSLQVGQKVCT